MYIKVPQLSRVYISRLYEEKKFRFCENKVTL